jgi:hypothetical protein
MTAFRRPTAPASTPTAPTFSVIVPVYNAAATVAATVRSVLDQTDGDFELILIDDGSTDASLARMLDLANLDERIRVLSTPNAGVAETRNLGASLARGALLAFLDADDIWRPTKLAAHRALHAANPDIGVSYAQISFLEAGTTPGGAARTTSTVPAAPLGVADLIGENPVCTASNIVVTRICFDTVGGFDATMRHAEDQEWLARVAACTFPIVGIDQLLVEYRLSPAGLSSDLTSMFSGWRRMVAQHGDSIDQGAAEAVFCRYLARRALRDGRPSGEAMRFAVRGMMRNASAFLDDPRRGGMTLAGAMLSPLIPTAMRSRIFA